MDEIELKVHDMSSTLQPADAYALVLDCLLYTSKQWITPTDYADFHRLMSEWEDSHHTTLLLKEKK